MATAQTSSNSHDSLRAHSFLAQLQSAKIWIFLAIVAFLLTWGGYELGGRFGLLIGFFAAIGLITLVLTYTDWRLSGFFPGIELEGHDAWGVLRMTRELTIQSASQSGPRRRPAVYMTEHETPFAYASGLFRSSTRITLSRGLIERFKPEEIRAVLAYEIERLRTEHIRSTTAGAALAGLILTLAGALDAGLFLRLFRRSRLQRWKMGPMTLLVSPFITLIMRFAVSRSQILDVDEAAASLLGDARPLARALQKLDAYAKTLPLDLNLAEAPMFMVDPLQRVPYCRKLSVQPTVEERVLKLIGRYPV